MPEDRLYYWG